MATPCMYVSHRVTIVPVLAWTVQFLLICPGVFAGIFLLSSIQIIQSGQCQVFITCAAVCRILWKFSRFWPKSQNLLLTLVSHANVSSDLN